MRQRRLFVSLAASSLCLVPRSAHAEVADKIPSADLLATIVLIQIAVTIALLLLLKSRPLGQAGCFAALLLPGVPVVYELRFTDIAAAVLIEMGSPYIVLVWMLVLVPAVGALTTIALGANSWRRKRTTSPERAER